MKLKTVLLLVILTMCTASHKSKMSNIPGRWQLNWNKSGFFPKDDLLFVKTDQALAEYIFEFKEDGTILHGNDDAVECPVGYFTLREGRWKLKNGLLTLELRGLKEADYWYWWIVEYKVEITEGSMWLRVNKIHKNRQLPPTKTWEELMKSESK